MKETSGLAILFLTISFNLKNEKVKIYVNNSVKDFDT